MSFLKTVFNILSDNREIKEPIVYKEIEEPSPIIKQLTELKETHTGNLDTKKIENHLKLFSIGQTGEKSVMFELKNSMHPLIVLHNVCLEFDDYKAQMDFVIITHKFILILEVKKLFGNIRITDKGEFQRIITKNNRIINKEGMYSPLNQVDRHVEILEKFLTSKGVISKCPIRGAVTFANPKTIIDISKNTPTNIQSKVIRHDRIKWFLKDELDKKSPVFMLDHSLHEIAQVIFQNHVEQPFNEKDYILKSPTTTKPPTTSTKPSSNTTEPVNSILKQALMEYRLNKSRELNIKPYHIFTNKTLDELIEKKPHTSSRLIKIEGIGGKTVQDYGEDLVTIIKSLTQDIVSTKATTSVNSLKSSMINGTLNTDDRLKEALMTFRTKKSKELNVKPYYIFKNQTLEFLIEKKPKTIQELLKVEGFGPEKTKEFGKEIIEIFNRTSHT